MELFKSNNPQHTREDMVTLRTLNRELKPNNQHYIDLHKTHPHYLKLTANQMRSLTKDQIYIALKVGAVALKLDMPKYLGLTQQDNNIKDLEKFLNQDLKDIYNPNKKEFRKFKHGIKFLDQFTRKYYTSVLKQSGALEDNYIDLFEVCNISLHLATPPTKMNSRRYFTTYTHASAKNRLQFASNFNPLISAYIFQTYGLRASNNNTINLHSSSEGWLGRLLASYYVAYKNPTKQIKYKSIDPNIKVIQAFNKLVKTLREYKDLKNWNPKIINRGSEEEKAYSKNYKIDVSFTSPPYLNLEEYPDTAIFKLQGIKKPIKISYLDKVQTLKHLIKTQDVKIGDKILYKKKYYRVLEISKTNQCATLYTKPRLWDNLFCKPTFKNIYKNLNHKGYLVWNVVDNKQHRSIEKSSTTLAQQQGFKLLDILKYPLVRKPGAVKDISGKNIRLADIKKPYEPIFIFTPEALFKKHKP